MAPGAFADPVQPVGTTAAGTSTHHPVRSVLSWRRHVPPFPPQVHQHVGGRSGGRDGSRVAPRIRARRDGRDGGHVRLDEQRRACRDPDAENRSFDHYFGTLARVPGFGDPTPLRFQNGSASSTAERVLDHPAVPLRHDDDRLAGRLRPRPHLVGTHAAWDDGSHDGWVWAKTNLTMGYYTRNDIPFQYALADAFTVCDANFCCRSVRARHPDAEAADQGVRVHADPDRRRTIRRHRYLHRHRRPQRRWPVQRDPCRQARRPLANGLGPTSRSLPRSGQQACDQTSCGKRIG